MAVGLGSRGANATRVALGAENSTLVLVAGDGTDIILGTGLDDNNGDRLRPLDADSTIQFRTGADAFANVVSGSGAVRTSTATDLTNDGALLVGERLSTANGAGVYIDGREVEDGAADTATEVRDDYTEWQWGLDFAFAAAVTTYDFQVRWVFKPPNVFIIGYISITTAAAGLNPMAFLQRFHHQPVPNPLLRM